MGSASKFNPYMQMIGALSLLSCCLFSCFRSTKGYDGDDGDA